ncbi:MAG: hypothetical protein N4A70_02550 [Pelagimonas sp.]|jgi:hypothetical protein|nr:hypothetical protein [Pelagimonas sp.]
MDFAYQRIWDADQRGNGVAALRPDEVGDAQAGYVIVNEPADAVTSDWKVLEEVVIPNHKRHTYDLCMQLMDNYALQRATPEILRPQEQAEETQFIQAILDTEVIQTAGKILEDHTGAALTPSELGALIHDCWFAYGQSGGQAQATGFEHVFVGEQGAQHSRIGGYHYWHKYWLDDGGAATGADHILYKAPRYGGAERPDQGILIPEIVTLQMDWDAPGGDGGHPQPLSKPIGGFFVGCSPEGLIALGLIRNLTRAGKWANINGADYQLDLHRLDGSRGIRTFFPRFLRANVTAIDDPSKSAPLSPAPANPIVTIRGAGVFRIVAAMINPPNPEGGREFLQIINASDQPANLRGWSITAPNGTRFHLASRALDPGEIFRFTLPVPNGVLRNRSGEIGLYDAAGSLVQLCEYASDEGQTEGAVVLF